MQAELGILGKVHRVCFEAHCSQQEEMPAREDLIVGVCGQSLASTPTL